MRGFWKRLWAALLAPPDIEYPVEEPEPRYYRPERKQHEAWCPMCGWSGTNVEFHAHLQNHHRDNK